MAANLIVMSDDDDEIEDDLWEIAANYVNNFVPRRRRTFHDCGNPLTELDDVDFHVRFRLNKALFCRLLGKISCTCEFTHV